MSLPPAYEKLTLLAGSDADLWAATINKKPLLHIRGQSFQPEKASGQIASVLRTSNGDAWWGTREGIWRMSGSTFTWFPLPPAAVPDFIYDMMPSVPDGGLWVKLGDVGFVHFNQGIWNLHAWPQGAPIQGGTFRYGPSASYQDSSGRFWLGYTSGQIYVLKDGQATAYTEKDGLNLGRIKVIRGGGGHIWVGGELGLALFSKGRFHRVQLADAQPLGAVGGIIETSTHGLWLSAMNGIVDIPTEEIDRLAIDPDRPVRSRRFDFQDGLPGSPQMTFTNSTAVRTGDGHLWFATANDLAWIDPDHIAKNSLPPPVSIVSVTSTNGQRETSNPLTFSAGTHSLEIDYAGLSLSIPERVQFRYKLDGIDADWQDVGTRRQAFYSNLGPGPYHFWVTACNNDGVWNTTGAFVDFSIAPAYYQTLWFRSVCVIALAILLWALYQLRLQRLAHQFNLALEARVDERTRIARDLHDTLLQSFQGLMLRLQVVNDLMPPGEAKQQLDKTLERADQAMAEGRSAVYDLRSSTMVVNNLAEAVRALGEELATEETAFRLVVEGPARELHPIIRDELYRIAREALRNASSHARAHHIETEITYGDRAFRLRIRDDGAGIPEDVMKEGRRGHYGLTGMRERARQIGGKLEIWSGARAGTEIELNIPGSIAYRSSRRRSLFRLFAKKGN